MQMTPKNKAEELIASFRKQQIACLITPDDKMIMATDDMLLECSIQCALIAVEEILEATSDEKQIQYDNGEWSRSIQIVYSEYWLQVKEYLNKME